MGVALDRCMESWAWVRGRGLEGVACLAWCILELDDELIRPRIIVPLNPALASVSMHRRLIMTVIYCHG